MSHAHVCDECKRVAPLGEAVFWWRLASIEGVLLMGEKDEYHFCSWPCLRDFSKRRASLLVEEAR